MRRKVVGILERGATVYWVLSCGHHVSTDVSVVNKMPKTMICKQCDGGVR